MKNKTIAVGLIACLCWASCIKQTPPVDENQWVETLKINQVQVIASHNSYRLKTYEPLYQMILTLIPLLPNSFNPLELDYTHVPLAEQLSTYKMRGLELDIYHDPLGGHFYYRGGNTLIGEAMISHIPELLEPGCKILHIPDIDYMTHHYTFKSALREIKKWSEAHPNHLPLYINVEPKEDAIRDQYENDSLVFALKFNPNAADSLDDEVREVFGEGLEQVITPDEIRGSYATLDEATRKGNLPTIAQARGKIFFILDTRQSFYKEGHSSLQGRVMFQYTDAHTPESCFVIANDPISNADSIPTWVKQGYMIRTRADAGTYEAREGDYSMWNAARKSGAQIISTDYYKPDDRYTTQPTEWSSYHVSFPNGELAVFNPFLTDSVKYRGLKIKE